MEFDIRVIEKQPKLDHFEIQSQSLRHIAFYLFIIFFKVFEHLGQKKIKKCDRLTGSKYDIAARSFILLTLKG